MSNLSLWPSKTEIMNLGENTPKKILERQASFLADVDSRLEGKVSECGPTTGMEPLMTLTDTFSPLKNTGTKINQDEDFFSKSVAYRFSVGRKDRVYTAEILRIRHKANFYWPVEIWDSLNSKRYHVGTQDTYEACLREIFTSDACLQKLRYIIIGAFIV